MAPTPATNGLRPAIFVDRDGVLNVDKGYAYQLGDLALFPGAAQAVATLKRRGYVVVVVSNQSGIARGMFTEADAQKFNAALDKALRRDSGAGIDAFFMCPHHPDGTVDAYKKVCDCRKPAPGMLLKAAKALRIDLAKSYMVGDRPDDITAGLAAGVTPIQVKSKDYEAHPQAKAQVASLIEAIAVIP